ncbi:GNAT family N-acetyltransferase [Pedobacter flavus]|uniref:GNAT family N-acetyltransferase n=1 Tax=Pedobacter flavus TaxID=3113906 RepID=A0ABU7H2T6_9SPHI|nr:GNAT family N-acetyltransferase [Pedobacter sp. VNH31]MEE1885620.1 GNAT family N-acetyltransferase [Pedobacter sp. VNH31]
MLETKIQLNEEGDGKILIEERGTEIAFMEISIAKNFITVYHTEVNPSAAGRGLGKKLLQFVVNYAKNNDLKIIPLCPFVLAQFKRNEAEYTDIWAK